MNPLLVPVDLSKVTDQVVAEAVRLARLIGAPVVLLHVTEPRVGFVDYGVVAVSIAQVTKAAMKNAGAQLETLKQRFETLNVPVETKMVPGIPAEEILTQASAFHAAYIVIGSHGHGAIYDALVGSTTHAVLKRAVCPVLVVPAGISSPVPTSAT